MDSPNNSSNTKRYQRIPKDDGYNNALPSNISDDRNAVVANRPKLSIKEVIEQQQQRGIGGKPVRISTASDDDDMNNDSIVEVISSSGGASSNASSSSSYVDDDETLEISSLVDDPNSNNKQRQRRRHYTDAKSNLFRNHSASGAASTTAASAASPSVAMTTLLNTGSYHKQQQQQQQRKQNIRRSSSSDMQYGQQQQHRSIGGVEMVGSNSSVGQRRYKDNPNPLYNNISASSHDNNSNRNIVSPTESEHHIAAGTKSPTLSPGSPSRTTKKMLRLSHSNSFNDDIMNNNNDTTITNVNYDSDWDDIDDDEAGLRRYHPYYLEYAKPSDIPMPAEFSHPSSIYDLLQSIGRQLYNQFIALRTSARQRRAARLLTMPSESWRYKLHACLLTWCCDATDAGILLVVSCLLLWISIGIIGHMGSSWWSYGFALLLIRISARRIFELCFRNNQQQQQHRTIYGLWLLLLGKGMGRTRLPTNDTDPVVIGGGMGVTGGGIINNNNAILRARDSNSVPALSSPASSSNATWKDSRGMHGTESFSAV